MTDDEKQRHYLAEKDKRKKERLLKLNHNLEEVKGPKAGLQDAESR